MLFNSIAFVFVFLPLALLAFWASRKAGKTAAKLLLVAVSLIFYAWAGPKQLPLLLLSFVFTWAVGAMINRARIAERASSVRAWLVLGVVVDVGLLIWFKYANFVADNLGFALRTDLGLGHIALPLAISFFTFQEIAYLVDTARGETGQLGPLDFAVFTTFFPKLISGPIVRYREFVPQIQAKRWGGLTGRNAMVGLVMFAIGLFKKTVIADTLAPYTAALYSSARGGDPSFVAAWLAAIVFSLQVYFDFSGYSDMAIGAGRMFGVKLPLNFHSPFRAASIIEYWRRWHMTLQRFVVVYIFQPLSLPLNRLAATRGLKAWNAFWLATFLPIFTAFLILGIWHGAGWTFVVFGALQGVYVGVNEAWREFGKQRRRRLRRAKMEVKPPTWIHRALFHGLTLVAILYANVMFHAVSVGEGISVWRGMTGLSGVAAALPAGIDWGLGFALVAAIGMVFLFPNSQQIMGRYDPAINWSEWRGVGRPAIAWTWKPNTVGIVFAGAVLFLGVMFIQSGRAVFLYFNF